MKVMTEEERVADEKRKATRKRGRGSPSSRGGKNATRRRRAVVAAEKARLRREAEEAEKAREAEEARARDFAPSWRSARKSSGCTPSSETRGGGGGTRASRGGGGGRDGTQTEGEAERQARVAAERAATRARRGETSKGFGATMSVGFAYRAGRDEVDYSLKLRVGISSPATAVVTLPTSESARVAALDACTEAARGRFRRTRRINARNE